MRTTRWAVPAVVLCATSAAQATVTLTFSGTYQTASGSPFGVAGPTAPFSFQLTYDPALDTNTEFFPTGAALDSLTTVHEWHGYSESGITATNFTFGTK